MNTTLQTSVLTPPPQPAVATERSSPTRAHRPVRVVHLLGGSEGGGITTAVGALLSAFDRSEVDPSVVILRKQPGTSDSKLSSCAPHYISKSRGKLGTALKIARFCRAHRVDILHTHSISSNFYGRLAGMLSPRTRVVTTVHARTTDEIRGSLGSPWLERCVCATDLQMHRSSTQLIAVSEWLRDDLVRRGVSSERIRAIHHGVPHNVHQPSHADVEQLRASLNIPADSPVLAIVGRLTPVKNHDLLLDAARHLIPQHPQLVLLVIGDGLRRAELMERARRTLPPDSTRFVGWVNDVPTYLKLADIVVACSRSEGFGYTVLEAMACGTPVVASAVAAIPEIVRDGETGLLVEPDNPAALADAISRLLRDPDRRDAMGQTAQSDVAGRFSLQQEVARTCELYRQLRKDGD